MRLRIIIPVCLLAVSVMIWLLWSGPPTAPPRPSNPPPAEAVPRPERPQPAPALVQRPLPTPNVPNSVRNAPPPSSSEVRIITDLAKPFVERQAAIRRLSKTLRTEVKDLLYGYLSRRFPEDDTPRGQILKNGVMDALIGQAAPLPDLAARLAWMASDPSQQVVIRDYAVQHLVAFYPQLDRAAVEVAEASREILREALLVALRETDGSLAGTALLGLSRLAGQYPGFDMERIGNCATRLAREPQVGELARITALQVCAEMSLTDSLPVCLSLVAQTNNTPLRLSAIAAVGQLGGPSELPLLQSLVSDKNERLHPAARLALSRLEARSTLGAFPNRRNPSMP